MTEREYTVRFAKIVNAVPGVQMRILYDSGRKDRKKPYDAFVIYKGRHYSLEAKVGPRALETHQVTALAEDMEAGAGAYIPRYSSKGFDLIGSADGGLTERVFSQTWKKFKEPGEAFGVVRWMAGEI